MADAEMPTAASLSAVVAQIDDLIDRLVTGARATDRDGTEAVSASLYDAERALRAGRRAVEAARRRL